MTVVFLQISQLPVKVVCFVISASSNHQKFTHMDSKGDFVINVFIIILIR